MKACVFAHRRLAAYRERQAHKGQLLQELIYLHAALFQCQFTRCIGVRYLPNT
jgi:hypothetical protein